MLHTFFYLSVFPQLKLIATAGWDEKIYYVTGEDRIEGYLPGADRVTRHVPERIERSFLGT